VPLFTYYRDKYGYVAGQFRVAEWIAAQAISLPVGPHLAPGDPQRIVTAVKNAVSHAKGNG
jgi:dTDP-4-amino-4,6-dideoxygalactose transaminase